MRGKSWRIPADLKPQGVRLPRGSSHRTTILGSQCELRPSLVPGLMPIDCQYMRLQPHHCPDRPMPCFTAAPAADIGAVMIMLPPASPRPGSSASISPPMRIVRQPRRWTCIGPVIIPFVPGDPFLPGPGHHVAHGGQHSIRRANAWAWPSNLPAHATSGRIGSILPHGPACPRVWKLHSFLPTC